MTSRFPSRFGNERWFALMLVLALVLLSLFQLVCLIASYFQTDPYGLQEHEPGVFFLLLGSLFFSGFLLRTSQEELRRPLPLATFAGLVLGVFLGGISYLPYFFSLQLAGGIFGPLMALTSRYPTPLARAYMWPDFWLSTLAVLLSLLLYALVASLIARRTGTLWLGFWAAMLSAFITLLTAASTYSIIALIRAFPSPSQETLPILISFQGLPLLALLLGPAQVIHAALAGFVGSRIALRLRNRRERDRESP